LLRVGISFLIAEYDNILGAIIDVPGRDVITEVTVEEFI